jgi:hypothetical protein
MRRPLRILIASVAAIGLIAALSGCTAKTTPATNVAGTSAKLNATVTLKSTDYGQYWFEYSSNGGTSWTGTTHHAYGSSHQDCSSSNAAESGQIPLSETVTGLQPGTHYLFRFAATRCGGSTHYWTDSTGTIDGTNYSSFDTFDLDSSGVLHGRIANAGSPDWSNLTQSAGRQDLFVFNIWSVSELATVKATRPADMVLAYQNGATCRSDVGTFDDGSGRTAPSVGVPCQQADSHENWFLHDSQGNRMMSNWGLPAMNIGNSGYQQAWAQNVAGRLAGLGYDGAFIDDMNLKCNCLSTPTEYPTDASYQSALQGFLAYVGPYLAAHGVDFTLPNIGSWATDPVVACDLVTNPAYALSGAVEEHFGQFKSFTDDMQQIKCTQDAGKWFFGSTNDPSTSLSAYAQGEALLWTEGHTVVARSPDYIHDYWQTEYDQANHLGSPSGDAFLVGGGAWRRNFQNGYVVVDPTAKTASITLSAP